MLRVRGDTQGDIHRFGVDPTTWPEHLEEQRIDVHEGVLLLQDPVLERFDPVHDQFGDLADGLMAITVTQQQGQDVADLAVAHASGVQGDPSSDESGL